MAHQSCVVSHPPPYAPLRHHQSQHHNRNNNNNKNNLVQFKYPTLLLPRTHHHNASASASNLFGFPRLRRPNISLNALDSDAPDPHHQGSVNFGRNESYQQWDSLTAKFSGAANIPFLLLQMPQIILNARNLAAGNNTALMAVPWLGMLTSLLGNLSLLSYFAKKREQGAMVVQTLGVVSTFVVLAQLALAEAMPLPYFLATSVVVVSGLFLNFMNYFGLLNAGIFRLWEDFITIGGLSVLPQIMWSTFVPYIPNSILPGAISFVIAVLAVTMARSGKLSEQGVKFVGGISGWTATLLFMWMPVSQMWTNYLNPENMKGLSAISMLLAMIGNGLMLPRALLIRDLMWFTGSAWATFFYGYGNIACLYLSNIISKEFFLAATAGLVSWIGMAFWRDSVVHGYSSPLTSISDLVSGS
ncbi:maltose excess protein 1-like, chloroplastic isoform X1 [Arachis duranensis]|uniref:Maltose excess protein 1-like, chloroplastic isoform X1 n=2 Tax=Arachis duranensis TaxID=130453 RepID=A0A6P4CLL0_ARADU|nr:maltose excess protein 1-like, chloroplastic isoform X1 [Arachis duranensis]